MSFHGQKMSDIVTSFKFSAFLLTSHAFLPVVDVTKMMRYRSFGEGTGVLFSVIGLGGSGYGRIYGEYDEETAKAGIR